ncbi:MAG: class I SAM-dependent methyltransferase [Fuerstiella sp.]|jgi:SAM-dependent methyltransferase|nr:class I SAM-dependent methyltransferase [Fuerstiella sp.]MCP4511646.1 class I SAM-dependent methyltransferase [Fuerstiella sp.]MDG2131484.1 class I SAM-dependent methyltransferase [Fuerstiella sp.]
MSDAASSRPYREITTCTESYFERKGDSALGMGWPNIPDAVRRYDVMLDVIRPTSKKLRVLDFGCGTGHLLEHIQQRGDLQIDYHGVDLSDRFIDICRQKHPHEEFTAGDVLQHPELLRTYDYAIINGVFTSKCSMTHDQMFGFVQRILKLVYSQVTKGMAFNATSKQVDWERDDLFHLPLDQIAGFLCAEVSRNFVIRNDYGLYEFTTYVFHDDAGTNNVDSLSASC